MEKKKSLVILAGGRGTRFIPLTTTIPKPLLKVAGKNPLENDMDSLLPHISEIILVVNYIQEEVRKYFGDSYQGVPIKYVDQGEPKGTGHAFNAAKDAVSNDELILLYGDDIYSPENLQKIVQYTDAVVGKTEQNWQNFGVFKLKNEKFLDTVVEKPDHFISDLVNIGIFTFNKAIFDYYDKIEQSVRGEYELTDMIRLYAQDHQVEVVRVDSGWLPLSYPWDMLTATAQLIESIEPKNEGTIEEGATLKGKLILGKNSIIKSGAYLEGNFIIGDDCVIGPNCFLKGFVTMGNNCEVGNAVEVTRSIIGNSVNIKHLAYVADSIVGNNVNIAAGTITTNLRHDGENIKVMTNGKLIDTGLRKLGTLFGDNAKTGANTVIYPGRKLSASATTLPGEEVKEDK